MYKTIQLKYSDANHKAPLLEFERAPYIKIDSAAKARFAKNLKLIKTLICTTAIVAIVVGYQQSASIELLMSLKGALLIPVLFLIRDRQLFE